MTPKARLPTTFCRTDASAEAIFPELAFVGELRRNVSGLDRPIRVTISSKPASQTCHETMSYFVTTQSPYQGSRWSGSAQEDGVRV